MNTAPIAARAVRRAAAPVIDSVSRFRWLSRTGSLTAMTGQAGTFARTTTGTATDSAGATYTAAHSMPRWEARTFNGTPSLGLYMAHSSEDLTWPVDWTPDTATLVVEFIEAGTRTTTDAGLVGISTDAASAPNFGILSNGTNYYGTFFNGLGGRTVTLSTGPALGDACRIALQMEDNGTDVRIRLIYDPLSGATTTTAWSGLRTRMSALVSGSRLRLNRTNPGGQQGTVWVRQVAWVPGLLTPAEAVARL